MSKEYISAANTAKLVRTALKKAFPGDKFSVRSKTYSGGASINVSWVDGPVSAEVDPIVKQFEGGGFDGQQDLAYSYSHWLLKDGSAVVAQSFHNLDGGILNEQPAPDAVKVSFGADYIFTNREASKALYLKAAAVALADYALGSHVPADVTADDLVEDNQWGRHQWAAAYANKPVSDWGNGWVSGALGTALSRLRGDGTVTHDNTGNSLIEGVSDSYRS